MGGAQETKRVEVGGDGGDSVRGGDREEGVIVRIPGVQGTFRASNSFGQALAGVAHKSNGSEQKC